MHLHGHGLLINNRKEMNTYIFPIKNVVFLTRSSAMMMVIDDDPKGVLME